MQIKNTVQGPFGSRGRSCYFIKMTRAKVKNGFELLDILQFQDLFQDPWNDANMGDVLDYLGLSSRARAFPHDVLQVLALVPWSKFAASPVA